MIRLSRLADYGIVVMCEMAAHQGKTLSAKYLSEKTHISETAVMKILKLLAKRGLLVSLRGPKGGYMVECPPQNISILDVVNAIDGPVEATLCSGSTVHETCEFQGHCSARHGWNQVNNALQKTLQGFTLADFIPSAKPYMAAPSSPTSEHVS
jgi:FeS assembly SUF system regulator